MQDSPPATVGSACQMGCSKTCGKAVVDDVLKDLESVNFVLSEKLRNPERTSQFGYYMTGAYKKDSRK